MRNIHSFFGKNGCRSINKEDCDLALKYLEAFRKSKCTLSYKEDDCKKVLDQIAYISEQCFDREFGPKLF